MNSALTAARPQPGEPRPYRFPPVTRLAVDGGEVVAAHLPGQALAVAVLLLDAGAIREPVDRAGVAAVTAKALEEGTTARDSAAYALALESLGANLWTDVDWDSFRVTVEAPLDRLPAAVELLAEAARTPRLEETDVARVRDDEVTGLRMDWAQPGPRATAALNRDLYGSDLRYGRTLYGDPNSVAAVTPDDVRAFHRSWLTRPGTLLVAGDLDRLDLTALGHLAFGGTEPQPRELAGPLSVATRPGRRILLVDRPGSVQTTLRLGHTAPHRTHPDRVPTLLATTVLGGAFTSRLNHLLREERGYTYGIRAMLAQSRRTGRFLVQSSVQTAVTAPALADIVAEITRTRAGGVTEEELAVSRTWRAGQLSVEMQTPGDIADALATLVVYDLPDDHHAALRARLLDATVDEVSAAAARHLRPEDLILAVEGDAAKIRDDLVAADLGTVVDVPA